MTEIVQQTEQICIRNKSAIKTKTKQRDVKSLDKLYLIYIYNKFIGYLTRF